MSAKQDSRKRDFNENNHSDGSSNHDRKKKKKHKSERHERSRSSSRRHKNYRHRSPSYDRSRNKNKHYNDRGRDYEHKEHSRGYDSRRHGDTRMRNRERVEKDPYFEERRKIERLRRTDPKAAQELEEELEKKIILDEKEREYEKMKQKFKEAQKEMEEAKREDHSIIVYCLPLKAKEKHIWKFFSQQGCGKVRDIRIIRDPRSGRSKGVAYVEFYTSDSVQKSLTLSEKPFELRGRLFTSLKVEHSQAEKNRAAAAAKQMKVIKPVDPLEQQQETKRREMKVFVGGLTDKLAEIQQSQLKQIFEPFGSIDYVDIHRDPLTGKCKGYAFIQYSSTQDAKNAVRQMNGLPIGGQKITVQTVNTAQKGSNSSAGEEFLYSAGSKQALVNKLSRDAPTHSNLMRPPISTMCTPYLLLTNLFKMEGTTPKFFQDLKKEVMGQCQEFGIVQKCFVEKNNQGNIWVKFSDTQSSIKAQQKLNGKYFDNTKIFCYFVTENTYQTRVGI